MIHFAFFAANVFFNPNISETIRARRLKFFEDRKANDLEKKFFLNAEVLTLLICNQWLNYTRVERF